MPWLIPFKEIWRNAIFKSQSPQNVTSPFTKYKDSLAQSGPCSEKSSICITARWEQTQPSGLSTGVLLCYDLLPTDNPSTSEATEPNPHTHEKWTKTAQMKKRVKSRQVTAMRPSSKLDNFLKDFFFWVRELICIFWYYGHCSLEVHFKEFK